VSQVKWVGRTYLWATNNDEQFIIHHLVATSPKAMWQLEWFVVVEEDNWALLLAAK
jgi:hypothetical protein